MIEETNTLWGYKLCSACCHFSRPEKLCVRPTTPARSLVDAAHLHRLRTSAARERSNSMRGLIFKRAACGPEATFFTPIVAPKGPKPSPTGD